MFFSKRTICIEMLEQRTMLSSAMTLEPNEIILPQASPSSDVQGYTPAQIRHAYGFDQISFNGGTVTADGSGQTIAIVDAFDDPNLAGDLHVFDKQFDLPAPPSLRVVDQTGGDNLPLEDPGWASEISLDVEWVHAIAPGANILLVETNSDSVSDLMDGVQYARHAPGVSVVSLSWGGSEFVSFTFGMNQSESQTKLDVDFTTPANHAGVTFVAAAGDEGESGGIEWPASSPNVLSIGATTLNILDSAGTYGSEVGWNGTSGGYSALEPEPTYQEGVETTGARSAPDVAYDGDPNTGFAVYDSIPFDGTVGWQVAGGTSSGTPQWAALVAIADQGRSLAGLGTLDGASETLPALYSLYSPPGTAGYSTYTAAFNDISSGGGDGPSFSPAAPGYDIISGLGTPHAEQVVAALQTASAGSFTLQSLLASPITGVFVKAPPASIVGGTAGSISLRLSDSNDLFFTGGLSVRLYASADNVLSSDDTLLATLPVRIVSLGSGTRTVTLKFTYPTNFDGSSANLIASISTTAISTTPATAVAPGLVSIETPTVDLSTSYTGKLPVLVKPGKHGSVAIRITNLGNVAAVGTLGATLYPSTDGITDFTTLLDSIAKRKIKIGAGKFIMLTFGFVDPSTDVGGAFELVASITSATQPVDDNSVDDTVTIATRSPA